MPERKRGAGSAGRFGPRYGRVARRRVSEIEGAMRREHACPDCGATRVSRDGTGIWECSRCGHRFTGGSYRPETPGGRTARQSIRAALSEGGEEDATAAPADAGEGEGAEAPPEPDEVAGTVGPDEGPE